MPRPTFLVCGGQRCGTTAIWQLLDDHPEVFVAQPVNPEPKFFLSDENGSVADYESRWFSETGSATAIGEKSTSYLETPGTAERIAVAYPDIQLVFVLRHPAERAVSNYLFSSKNGLETRSFADALAGRNEPKYDKGRVQLISPFDYISRGQYSVLVNRYQSVFSPGQMLFLLFDDLVDQPQLFCQQLYEFIGVSADFAPPSLGSVLNSGPEWMPIMTEDLLSELIAEFRESNVAIGQLTGRDLESWNRPSSRLQKCLL